NGVFDGDAGSLDKLLELKLRWERRFQEAVPRRIIPRFPSKLTFLPRRMIVSTTVGPIDADQGHSSRDSPTEHVLDVGHTQEIGNSCNIESSNQNPKSLEGPGRTPIHAGGPPPEVFVGNVQLKMPCPDRLPPLGIHSRGIFPWSTPLFPSIGGLCQGKLEGPAAGVGECKWVLLFPISELGIHGGGNRGGPMALPRTAGGAQQWEQGMSLRWQKHTKVPIWIRIRHLPMEYWTEDGLSAVASGVGTPLYRDKITKTCSRLDFARVCVMLDFHSTLPKHLVVLSPVLSEDKHTPIKVDIEYEWLPLRCKQCCSLGHTALNCPEMKVKKMGTPWQPMCKNTRQIG
ncbi:UNVERIFIED_CONTAM: hypothetical protein Sradi_7209000, partial [Sesamum radiatum]